MHEFSIVKSLINILNKKCKKEKISEIKKINLKIGILKTIMPESLNFAFEILSKKTKYENTKLIIKIIPVKMKCNECKNNITFNNTFNIHFLCKKCGSTNLNLLCGNELLIDSVEYN
ncbi:MAG: hydrogenase maturation nickel metallochaperone HypA [bacterium]